VDHRRRARGRRRALTGHSTAANNNRNLRVTSVSALTLGIAETLVVDAVADTAFTLTIAKKLTQPATPVRRSFTFEEYDAGRRPDGAGDGVPDLVAQDQRAAGRHVPDRVRHRRRRPEPARDRASPYYTAPTLTTSIALTLADATIRYGGADIVTLTAFEMTYDLTARRSR
jgi:hypothetical protein